MWFALLVLYWDILGYYESKLCTQDSADGEFSRVKTRLSMHLARHPEEQVGHIGVKDSRTFQQFGTQQMSTPGQKAKLDSREFIDLKPEEMKERKATVGQVKTLTGIQSKFFYVCLPDGKV